MASVNSVTVFRSLYSVVYWHSPIHKWHSFLAVAHLNIPCCEFLCCWVLIFLFLYVVWYFQYCLGCFFSVLFYNEMYWLPVSFWSASNICVSCRVIMSDAWSDIQALKNKQSSLREKLAQRKKQCQEVVAEIIGKPSVIVVKSGNFYRCRIVRSRSAWIPQITANHHKSPQISSGRPQINVGRPQITVNQSWKTENHRNRKSLLEDHKSMLEDRKSPQITVNHLVN